ncbi:MAG: recombination protein RecR [Candidatus Eremiobacteraeota bacterium]|nr:recombination protein RecR [Candidatus Eremiobacteraeota bacterium]
MSNSTRIAEPVQALINEFSKLPTIGPKTAARLVFYLLNRPRSEAETLAEAIVALKERVRLCSRCFSITESDPCAVCADPQRDAALICVVAEAKDVFAIERTSAYAGRYHVLGGLISPMDGIGPSQLRVRELVDRVASESPAEIVVATNPNAEGEATALYLSRLLAPSGVKVTRLAYGLPIGGDLDYADENTLARAIEGRRVL